MMNIILELLPFINGIIRTGIAATGGYLVSIGILPQDKTEAFIGIAMVLIAGIWSWVRTYKLAKEAKLK